MKHSKTIVLYSETESENFNSPLTAVIKRKNDNIKIKK